METPKKKTSVIKIIFTFLYLFFWPALLLFIAGDWYWIEGWIFGAWLVLLCMTTILYLYIKNPALLTERYRQPGTGDQKGWDKYVVYGLLIGFISWIVIMPLDAKRYGWSEGVPLAFKIVGGAFLCISFFFFLRAFVDNSFLSPLVRIQEERKQQVVTTGVYGFVRHPMYLGALLMFLGAPLLMGSYFGIGLGFVIILLLAWRTTGEEKMLIEELEGYEEYKKKVRYRFVPFVW